MEIYQVAAWKSIRSVICDMEIINLGNENSMRRILPGENRSVRAKVNKKKKFTRLISKLVPRKATIFVNHATQDLSVIRGDHLLTLDRGEKKNVTL